jgi:hypothetical protein
MREIKAAHGRGTTTEEVMKTACISIVVALMLGACEKEQVQRSDPTTPLRKEDAPLQAALDELTRLQSFTEAGLTYAQYSDRLLTAKGNIDVALQRTTDEAAKEKIQEAVRYYLAARNEWKVELDSDSNFREAFTQEDWTKGSEAADFAAKYAVADTAARAKMDAAAAAAAVEQEKAQQQADAAAAAAAAEQEKVQQQAEAAAAAAAAEQEKAQQQADATAAAAAAEQERIRRFAPDGTGYSTTLISITTDDGVASIPPGVEIKVIKKNPNGTLRIQSGKTIGDAPAVDVTNDRNLAAAVRADDQAKQASIREWQAQQAAAAAELDAEQSATPEPTPTPPPQPAYISPLDQGAYR